MQIRKIDESLTDHFSGKSLSPQSHLGSHGIAALLDVDFTQEIIKELPAVGPVTYLTKLGVLLADVEKEGFDFLTNQQSIFAISDGEALCDTPKPGDVDEKNAKTSREMMRGTSSVFMENEGKGIKIGVLDTGIQSDHPAFEGRVVEQVNCVQDKFSGDVNGHGTHVAGSIIGKDIGVAQEAEIIDFRVFGTSPGASVSSILMGLDHCVTRHVDIVNMSLGSDFPSYVLENAVDTVSNQGIPVCVAAGNSGPDPYTINSPSSSRLAISVAATDSQKRVAWFSSRGPCSWNTWSKPDCAGFGEHVYSASHKGGYTVMSGTSMATPGVVGVAACIMEHENENSNRHGLIDWILRNGGNPHGQSSTDVGTGFVSLMDVESYVSNSEGLAALSRKKKSKIVKQDFFKKTVLSCKDCTSSKILHQISHRKDGTMRFRTSCRTHREISNDGAPSYEDIILEKWQHIRIAEQQILKALKQCGKCGKHGLVSINDWSHMKLKQGLPPHSEGDVGCLYCQAKGKRQIPTRFAELW